MIVYHGYAKLLRHLFLAVQRDDRRVGAHRHIDLQIHKVGTEGQSCCVVGQTTRASLEYIVTQTINAGLLEMTWSGFKVSIAFGTDGTCVYRGVTISNAIATRVPIGYITIYRGDFMQTAVNQR